MWFRGRIGKGQILVIVAFLMFGTVVVFQRFISPLYKALLLGGSLTLVIGVWLWALQVQRRSGRNVQGLVRFVPFLMFLAAYSIYCVGFSSEISIPIWAESLRLLAFLVLSVGSVVGFIWLCMRNTQKDDDIAGDEKSRIK